MLIHNNADIPIATPEPVHYNTNQTRAMMVNWSPSREMTNPSHNRLNAGRWRGECCNALRVDMHSPVLA
jgi:hypothetical protein